MECFLWASHTPVQLLGASVGSGTEYAGQDQRAAFKEPTVSLGAVDITMGECWGSTPSTKCSGEGVEKNKEPTVAKRQASCTEGSSIWTRSGRSLPVGEGGRPSRQKEYSYSKP